MEGNKNNLHIILITNLFHFLSLIVANLARIGKFNVNYFLNNQNTLFYPLSSPPIQFLQIIISSQSIFLPLNMHIPVLQFDHLIYITMFCYILFIREIVAD